MQSDYRKMRMILLYDLPMVEDKDVRAYTYFHKELKKCGFYMLQYSMYVKALTNQDDYEKTSNKVMKIIPNKGNIIILRLTEKQYNDMTYLSGEKNKQDIMIGSKTVIRFGGDD